MEENAPITIICNFDGLEQKIIFEALILPEFSETLKKYGHLLKENGGKAK